ncbi:MAG: TolC family protein, partial [Planctomycetia bacterium]
MKNRSVAIISFLIASILPGCVIIPQTIETPNPVVVEIDQKIQTSADAKIVQFEVKSTTIENQIFDESPGKAPAFATLKVLSVDDLVREVLLRNPTLAAMTAASEAAWSKYPQAISLDDPSLGGWFAPGTIGSNQVNFALRVEFAQKLPGRGKLKLRGDKAQAEANATEKEIEDVRLQLTEEAKNAYFEFYLVDRAMEVNENSLKLLSEFRQTAETRYRNGQVPQQDVLQADVEISLQKE